MNEDTLKRIEQDALEYAKKHSAAPDKETPDWIIADYKAGAIAESKRADDLLAENERLKEKINFSNVDRLVPQSILDEYAELYAESVRLFEREKVIKQIDDWMNVSDDDPIHVFLESLKSPSNPEMK